MLEVQYCFNVVLISQLVRHKNRKYIQYKSKTFSDFWYSSSDHLTPNVCLVFSLCKNLTFLVLKICFQYNIVVWLLIINNTFQHHVWFIKFLSRFSPIPHCFWYLLEFCVSLTVKCNIYWCFIPGLVHQHQSENRLFSSLTCLLWLCYFILGKAECSTAFGFCELVFCCP